MKKDSILYVVAFTFAVCAFFVFFLALANEATKERVAANQIFAERVAVLSAFGMDYATPEEALEKYGRYIREKAATAGAEKAWLREENGRVYLAARVTGAGAWGPISVVVAADSSLERISGIQVLSHNETPGLGGRIAEAWFSAQFRGERAGPEGIRITVGAMARGTGDTDPDNGVLDGVSGATRSTQSMETIVNGGIRAIRTLAEEAR
ncbi:MAG TPA: FMN-binding protein [Magnetospirillaceae bacterium]|nr:FMN-binding protein [Magnetospirillaceae bacterium]